MRQSSIKKAAAKWLVELDTAENMDEHWPAFEAWLNERPEHRAAFVSMEKSWRAVEELKVFHLRHNRLSVDPMLRLERKRSFLRPNWGSRWTTGVAVTLAASVAIAFYLVPLPRRSAPTETVRWTQYSTDYGELRSELLADGSRVELNTNTLIHVTQSPREREVVLDRGEAMFEVRHDPDRPFFVRVGIGDVRAVGTTFSVRRKSAAEALTVVEEGRVEVTAKAHPSQMVEAEHAATVSASGVRVEAVDPEKMSRMQSWRKGELAFKGETLEEVVAEFNRYNRMKLQIDDPQIAQQRIGGTFSANDPVGFAELLEHTFGILHELDAADGSDTQTIHLSRAKG